MSHDAPKPDESKEQRDEGAAAAKEAAQQAAAQAKATAAEAVRVFKGFDLMGQVYVASLLVVVVGTVVFHMISFEVRSNGPVSPTMADEQREWEAKFNADFAGTAALSCFGWPLLPLAGGGVLLFMWAALTKQRAGWIPLATVACSGGCVLIMMVLFVFSFASGSYALLPDYLEPDIDMTLLGYWLPLAAAFVATGAPVKRIFDA